MGALVFSRDDTAAQRAVVDRQRHIPGEPGLWVLIFGELLLFGLLFGVFLFYRARDPEGFAASQHTLNVDLGVVNTLVLLVSSLLVIIGVHAVQNDASRVARGMFLGALLCGGVFAVNKIFEYSAKISAGLLPTTNDFYMYYYVLTGLHLVHVLVGMELLVFMYAQAGKKFITPTRFGYIEGAACFWHLVDLLWIVLFPLIYLVRT